LSSLSAASGRRVSAASVGGFVALAAVSAVLAAGVGALSAGPHLLDVAALAVAVLLGALIARVPTVLFSASLLALCYAPEYLSNAGVFAHPQLPKGLVYFAVLGMALRRGIRPRYLVVTGGYVLLALLSWLWGHLNPALTLSQVLSSFVTLTVGWTALAVAWDYEEDVRFLRVLAFLPVASVLLGVLLQAAGLHPVFRAASGADTTTRLQGASIPAQLALTAFIGAVTASICFRLTRWRWAPVLLALDVVILGLTVSRGASIALGLALLWPALRFALSSRTSQDAVTPRWLRIGAIVVLFGIVLAYAVPALLARNSVGTYYQSEGIVYDKTSGRSRAWAEFYAIAQKSALFGHGLGSGPITTIQEKGFLAQHNEYLRLFLEGGYVAGGIVLFAIVVVIGICIARAPKRVRIDLAGLAVGFAVLSYTDNTLTSVNLAVPFCLVFGILGSYRPPRPMPDSGPLGISTEFRSSPQVT
jgi:teichuronic acid biosynthesis protein TuaE